MMACLLAGFATPARAQTATGSLAGTLTDVYSRPVAGATVILHSAATGAETRTVTGRNGRYRLEGLAPGEYWVEARSAALGQGVLEGLYIPAGHEARVQTAVDFKSAASAGRVLAGPVLRPQNLNSAANTAPQMAASEVQKGSGPAVPAAPAFAVSNAPAPPVARERSSPTPAQTPVSAARQPVTTPVSKRAGSDVAAPHVAVAEPVRAAETTVAVAPPPVPASPAVGAMALDVFPSGAQAAGTMAVLTGITAMKAALQSTEPTLPITAAALTPEDAAGASVSTVDGEHLRELPMAGRDWAAFLGDRATAEIASPDDEESPATTARTGLGTRVDDAPVGLAFGSGRRSSVQAATTPGREDTSVAEVKIVEAGPGEGRASVKTRSGSNGLHGQAFVFSRQNLWNARNPYTQQIVETAPATSTTVPVFTPEPYTPPDRRLTWGVGAGGDLRRNRLFWFAALDGDARNDPAVATVRHPANFFAQPSNDEMQVLSARLALPSSNPVVEGLGAYSKYLEALNGLLGEVPRTSSQWTGFARLDWHAAERHRLMLESSGAMADAMGGSGGRVSEMYGSHSLGNSRASSEWVLGRWEAFLTPNLLAVTQGSLGKQIIALTPETPSPLEATLNASSWGQLPQMVVDSRYGFSIGAPARSGFGIYPAETTATAQESVDWIRGPLLMKGGFEVRHNGDRTSRIVNHAGTYHYARIENFISDALVYVKYGLAGALDPLNQHNCDQRGKAWRDATGQLHGLGYLPCYSYYTQTLGPTDWHLSTNDWSGFGTLQWQPAKSFVVSAGVRWDREQWPPPIALVNNPELPLTQKVPNLGDEWEPRLGIAWGRLESHWPVLRAGYGMYFGRTSNAVLETALTQTGSANGDLNFFLRPTDNLLSRAGGAPPFPYVLSGAPGTFEKPAAVEFAPEFKNGEIHQGEVGIEEELPGHVLVQASAAVSLARRLPITMDTNYDPAVNPKSITYGVVDASGKGPIKAKQITVPFYASWPTPTGSDGRLNAKYQQITQIEPRANSTYEAATLEATRYATRGLTLRARYTYAHAMDWNPNESTSVSGASMLDPTDLRQEYGTSGLDVRHTASAMVLWRAPWNLHGGGGALANGWLLSGTGSYHSGLPYTMRTAGSIPELFETTGVVITGLGPSMNGYGGDPRVYGVGRNTYRYPQTWKADVRVGKRFRMQRTRELELLAESFNLFNHQNVTQIEAVGYTIEPGSAAGSLPTFNFLTGLKPGQTEFGQPLNVNATNYYRERQFDFGIKLRF